MNEVLEREEEKNATDGVCRVLRASQLWWAGCKINKGVTKVKGN